MNGSVSTVTGPLQPNMVVLCMRGHVRRGEREHILYLQGVVGHAFVAGVKGIIRQTVTQLVTKMVMNSINPSRKIVRAVAARILYAVPMYFRQLRESDYRSMRDIFHDAFDHCRLPIVDFGFSWRARSRPHSLGLFTGPGDLMGLAIVSIHPRNGGNRYLDYIAVHSSFRGGGAGSALLKRVVGESHAARLGMHLYPLRRTRAWYKSHGFEFTTTEYMNSHPYNTRQKKQTR